MIELKKFDYKTHLPIEPVAFSFAAEGAMGEGGGIIIVGKDAQSYHLNYYYDKWEKGDVCEVLPILRECQFGIVGGGKIPDGWTYIYIGFGNHLMIHSSILTLWTEKTKTSNEHRSYIRDGVPL